MKNVWRKAYVIIGLLLSSFVYSPLIAQQTLTQINGWNAYVHLPAGYATSNITYPTIIFFPGIGEIGTNPALLLSQGPSAYIAQGWNGNVTVDGSTVEFIVISLQPQGAYPAEFLMDQRIQTIKSLYRTDPNRLYLTGLSHGGWCASTYVTGDAYGGPYTYASQIAAVVTVQGVIPDDNSPYPQLFDNFASSGGRYLGFEQANDGRDTRTVVDRMNATAPNSAIYVQTNFGGGGHCCWNECYGGLGAQPGIFMLGGYSQNLYQWLARQTLANNNNVPPVSNAGPDKTIVLPVNSAILNGSASDADGTIISYLWNQISGPSAAAITNGATTTPAVSNLIQGQYKFTLKVTDNSTASTIDTVMVTVNPDPATTGCNSNAPVTYYISATSPGEIYRPNGAIWKGGDTVKITGTSYSVIEFYNIAGDPCRPIVIMPQTTLVTPVFRLKGNCRYVKVWGGPTQYGIKVNNGTLAVSSCHHIEMNNIETTGGSVGVYCKQNPEYGDPLTWHPNYRMTKFTFKNIWVHDVNGEGMYIGITQPDGMTVTSTYTGLDTVIVPVRLDSVEISNCIVERTAWDGIQLSNARDGNKIFDNIIRDYGLINMGSQQAGMILGGNTNGDVYGNSISRGTGNGLQLFGYGVINVYNNILDSCGYDGATNGNGTQGQQTIYASDYVIATENNTRQTINVYGNTIKNPKTAGAVFITGYANNSYPSAVYNNGFCIPAAPANWQSIYIKTNVPGSTTSNNILSCTATNMAPTASAGNDISLTLPVNYTNLSGSGADPDGTIVSYNWNLIAGPAGSSIASSNAPVATISSLAQGVYSYQLTATDNAGATGRDTVLVTVNGVGNQAPTANAGNNISITLPVNSTNLSGTATDPDGSIVSYSWNLIAGPAGSSITGSNAAVATISNLIPGVYSYQLTVTDNGGATGRDTVIVTVNGVANLAPAANAGTNISITLPVNSTNLSGSGTDTDGTIIVYEWLKIAGPAAGTLTNVNTQTPTAGSLVQGIYSYQLTVTDNGGAIGRDTVTITVIAANNQLPTANAGNNISITLPVNSTNLSGGGTDADGTIVSYNWLLLSGPAGSSIISSNAAIATVSNLVQGLYSYQLTVTDNAGDIAEDTVDVMVIATANQAPTANAGNNINLTLPVNSTNLSGIGTDVDGTIVSWSWLKIAGPAAGTLINANTQSPTAGSLMQGVYSYQLTVTDNSGATGTDTVDVNINAAINILPVANAGNDIIITLPVNSAPLSGTGTDIDGNIVSYNWLKISGPATGSISNANTALATALNLVQGVYSYQLTITDNSGAIGKDTVSVTVNAGGNIAPTADAGNSINITLPVNTSILNGSGTDPDGTIASYSWLKITGPATGTLTNANTATATAISLVQGVYSFELTVTDNSGAMGKDTVFITVNSAGNILPTVNAGNDISLTLPVNSTNVSGIGTDADGTIVTYYWSYISGPGGSAIIGSDLMVASISNLTQGSYKYQLTVTDNAGDVGRDTINITVNAAVNILPVANAGNDISLMLPFNSTNLSGSGTDNDGTIVAYNWTLLSGPAGSTIIGSDLPVAAISNLTQGIYIYQLMVTDNSGAVDKDTMNVTVNAATNIPPFANAGNDISITLPVNNAVLNGSATDPDGTIIYYEWIKIAGPAAGTLTNANTASPTAGSLVQGVYSYQLTVADNNAVLDRDTVNVTVNAAVNILPTANAGNNISIMLPVNSTSLSGSGTDTDGTIVSYNWILLSGPAGSTIISANAQVASISNLTQGVYSYQLTVTDNAGATGKDTVNVTVYAALNLPPVANAGNDISITLPVNTTVLNGSATDPDGTIIYYAWIKIEGPAAGTLTNANTPSPAAGSLVQGVYSYQLTVADNSGAITRDTMSVTVNTAINIPPTANAGNNISITLPVNTTLLNGSGADADGTIVSYTWLKIAGPAAGILTNAATATSTAGGLVQGIYSYQLTVTDNSGATARDTVNVTVNAPINIPPVNIPPVANAGNNISITLPVNTTLLSGSGTDQDGNIASYAWVKIAGPASGTLTNVNTTTPTAGSLIQGVYSYQLTVTDNAGATGKDTVNVTVNIAAVNIAPAANAGNNISLTLPVNNTLLNGSGTDPDGTIVSYAWAKIAGPAAGTLTNANTATPTAGSLVQGVYSYQLTVTDNAGATGRDTVSVTVNAAVNTAPIANAGNDINIYLPVNSVDLNGSAIDINGTVVAYNWRVIKAAGLYVFNNANAAKTQMGNLSQGIYEIEFSVTDNNGAKGFDTLIVTVGNSRQTIIEAQVNVFPNPVNSILNASITSPLKDETITLILLDSRGAKVYQKILITTGISRMETIDMSKLKMGVYMLQVNYGRKKQIVKKIIKI